ncbi:unnamed protein product [Protopolystoma xenopodis]|uniref:Uncharacterized protein n=1 Tax=Protopolystoma xenopodis TaxID=117903 RepID=A0A3S4ZW91_9PLAT|nr:unnamed protein product [Protopolystoma xenopodis]
MVRPKRLLETLSPGGPDLKSVIGPVTSCRVSSPAPTSTRESGCEIGPLGLISLGQQKVRLVSVRLTEVA